MRMTSRMGMASSSRPACENSKTRPPVRRARSASSGRFSEGRRPSPRRLDAEGRRRDPDARAQVRRGRRHDPQRVGAGLLGREGGREHAGVVGHAVEPERVRRLAGDLQLGRQLRRLGHRRGVGVADRDRHPVADAVDALSQVHLEREPAAQRLVPADAVDQPRPEAVEIVLGQVPPAIRAVEADEDRPARPVELRGQQHLPAVLVLHPRVAVAGQHHRAGRARVTGKLQYIPGRLVRIDRLRIGSALNSKTGSPRPSGVNSSV